MQALAECPICGHPISFLHITVTHTSKLFCPKQYLGRRMHSRCAINRGIPVPPEDRMLMMAKPRFVQSQNPTTKRYRVIDRELSVMVGPLSKPGRPFHGIPIAWRKGRREYEQP